MLASAAMWKKFMTLDPFCVHPPLLLNSIFLPVRPSNHDLPWAQLEKPGKCQGNLAGREESLGKSLFLSSSFCPSAWLLFLNDFYVHFSARGPPFCTSSAFYAVYMHIYIYVYAYNFLHNFVAGFLFHSLLCISGTLSLRFAGFSLVLFVCLLLHAFALLIFLLFFYFHFVSISTSLSFIFFVLSLYLFVCLFAVSRSASVTITMQQTTAGWPLQFQLDVQCPRASAFSIPLAIAHSLYPQSSSLWTFVSPAEIPMQRPFAFYWFFVPSPAAAAAARDAVKSH